MPRGWPPLKLREIRGILKSLGFTLRKTQSGGSHECWELVRDDRRYFVHVDLAYPEFDKTLIKRMVIQAGTNKRGFYGATKKTAKKLG